MEHMMNHHLSRHGDPETSGMAAATLDLSPSERHDRILAALEYICPATDLEMAEALSARGYGREESCRRYVRTLREEHGRLVPAMFDGEQIRHQNTTGRWAECWIPGHAAVPDRAVVDTTLARIARCEQVKVDCVEHVRLDGHDYYLASALLETIVYGDYEPPGTEPPTDDGTTEMPGQIGLW